VSDDSERPTNSSTHDADALCWDAEGQPRSTYFDDVYFSREDGLAESRHVFLHGNKLAERWQALSAEASFTIFETGFGTGLNFLACWQLFLQLDVPAHLHFVSVEKYPLRRAELARALAMWPELNELAAILLQHYPPQPASGVWQCRLPKLGKSAALSLTLIFDDIDDALDELNSRPDASLSSRPLTVDAWFLDGFAPAKNPAMWSPALFRFMSTNSAECATAATFTVAGAVRRGLAELGFSCEKLPGFGRKREMLRAHLNSAALTQDNSGQLPSIWLYQRPFKPRDRSALVIGAGLAGAHASRALAQRGWQVVVLDASKVASGASGNSEGVVYTRPSVREGRLSEFNRYAQYFADLFYHNEGYYRACGHACGVFHLALKQSDEARLREVADYYRDSGNYLWLSDNSSAYTGVASGPGLLLPESGWLRPATLCSQLLDHPRIELREHSRVRELVEADGGWRALGERGELASASVCVVANARESLSFGQTDFLPLTTIRGQTSRFKAGAESKSLRTVLCGKGYMLPAVDGTHACGASFHLRDECRDLRDEDHRLNFDLANEGLEPSILEFNLDEDQPGRVGFRCTTKDYFPIAGPVPKIDAYRRHFAALAKNAKRGPQSVGESFQGLYLLTGLGSRGLAYAPLCAELLGALIAGGPLPLSRRLYAHLHPARFLIRSLIRGQEV